MVLGVNVDIYMAVPWSVWDTVTPLKYVEGGPGLTLPEVVYNSYSVRMFGGDGRLRIFKCAVPSSFTTKKQQDCRALCGDLGSALDTSHSFCN